MIADRRFAARQKLHRSPAVAATHCRERRATQSASRLPLAVDSFEGDALGGDELHRVKESVVAALALGDHGYIQLVMADLRVKNPGGWVEVDRVLSDLRTFRHIPPRRPVPGLGSFRQRPADCSNALDRHRLIIAQRGN